MGTDTLENKRRAAQILLVEDNPGDVILTRRAFQKGKIANEISVAKSGEEALAMLRKEGNYSGSPTPDIILLDLNLPRMSGQEVLEAIKSSDNLRNIPVIVLSSSRAEQDVVKSYNLHANGYIAKPVNVDDFNEVVNKLELFWFTLVVLPEPTNAPSAK